MPMSDDDLRNCIADAISRVDDWRGVTDPNILAEAVIRELKDERDALVKEAIRDLQEKYILVPKSQTIVEMAPPRLVINRDCTPLELPDEWKADDE
jgi:hypothetical protein